MWLCVCCLASISCFFCFKQKTVYEMRIRYWSADVCSSDLLVVQQRHVAAVVDYQFRAGQRAVGKGEGHRVERQVPVFLKRLALPREHRRAGGGARSSGVVGGRKDIARSPAHRPAARAHSFHQRSEETKYETQPLMTINNHASRLT